MTADATRLKLDVIRHAANVHAAAVESMQDRMKGDAPVSTPTETSTRPPGELRDSIAAVVTSPAGPTTLRGTVGSPVIQAATTDRGAKPHVIMPKRARVLRFFWPNGPVGPGVYHLPIVNHPGNVGTNWWTNGIARHWPEALAEASSRA